MQVELWLMNADGTDQHRLISFFGGQGSINVNSWALDSKRFAFVSYEM
jgi:Tol biopolymer transport system component